MASGSENNMLDFNVDLERKKISSEICCRQVFVELDVIASESRLLSAERKFIKQLQPNDSFPVR